MTKCDRITTNPEIMGGKPCIRGMRVTVNTIAGLIKSGQSIEEVLAAYPYLEREDVEQAISYQEHYREGDRYGIKAVQVDSVHHFSYLDRTGCSVNWLYEF